MKLIKVGSTVLNLANVVEVDLEKELENGGTGVMVYSLTWKTGFKDEEAAALRHYFTTQAADLDQEYKDYLVAQERKRSQADWRKRFHQFREEKGLDQSAAYSYEWWLKDSEDAPLPGGKQPGEESYAEWLIYIGEQLDETLNRHVIPVGPDREAFKAHCLATGDYNPTWNAYQFWQRNERHSVPVTPDEDDQPF